MFKLLLVGLMLFTLPTSRLEKLQIRAYDTPCKKATKSSMRYHKAKGDEYRMARGWIKGEPHRWCEYKKNGEWLVDDRTRDRKGWTSEEYGDYEIRCYVYPK